MKVSIGAIKTLREETGAPVGACRAALEEARGDAQKAKAILRRRGISTAAQRGDRRAGQGRVETYVHHDGRLGAMVEVNCETDFVARSEEFLAFCRQLAMHVAAMNPERVSGQAGSSGDGEAPSALLDQPFVKDQALTVGDLLNELIGKTGEKVVIRRITRFAVGEADHA